MSFQTLMTFFLLCNIQRLFIYLYRIQNQIKSNHFYCHITTAQVPWWVKFLWACSRQCKKNNKQFTYGQTVQKKLHWSIYSAPDSAKKQQQQFTYGQTVQKNNKQFTYGQTVQKNNKQFTYGQTVQKKLHWSIYSAPDSAKKTTTIYIWTVHIYRLYRRQCAKYTYIYSVHIVYYKDTLNYQRHIIHRMGTSTLCTLSIHNVVYT